MTRVVSNLWFEKEVTKAVDFYTSIIPNSGITRTTSLAAETYSGPPGSVIIIEFTLGGQNFLAFEAGAMDRFNHAFSIGVEFDTQEEIDRVWNAFLDNGGAAAQCGWLKDRWGLSWQILPRVLADMTADPDREKARRTTEAMLKMVKLDIATLQRAFNGQE
ncbi:putative 3-demethylubiquinone-9 3-methyltransferase (glyoxalase superfamily) [Rhizobium petrolearium]|uniref:VOC family protein n=1 Tax=Neorhizobium petrolearium TaxID=515361 RepID=UPI001AE7D257|nr:VOC family protein [Neorhizobium petrolearium]MBP1845424.1 putative 3-demethylubiquinone-9 3-methyltransferase (glyoxalase superfamily) [Neorhizobium petrolearium]